jgi:hypothetical protein
LSGLIVGQKGEQGFRIVGSAQLGANALIAKQS